MIGALLEKSWSVLLELSPWLLLGAVAGGLLHGLVPPGFVRRKLRGPGGVLRAVLLGVPLPLCSCGVIPAGLSLRRSGASTGASLGFLIATPQTGVDSVLVSAGFLGWPFALFKVAAALVTGLLGGGLAEVLAPDAKGELGAEVEEAVDRSPKGMLLHAIDLVRMIWRWLAFGVLVSAALSLWLPPQAMQGLLAYGTAAAFVLVLAISVPLYVCATASVPIAAALVAGGLPTGAALVFLMAGPATNVATIGAVYRAFGGRALAIYLSTIVAGSALLGLLYERLLGGLTAVHAHGAHDHAAPWAAAAALLLLALFAWFLGEDLRSAWARWRVARAGPSKVEIAVDGMTCNGCAARLERVLSKQEGVESASVRFELGSAVVVGKVDLPALHEAIRGAGFEPRA
ncbi:permease, partial [Myxococcota bacterium]|nr:permease [Myxococcota bacterium]